MKIEFTIHAYYELRDAVDYYNLKLEGLGDRFKENVQEGLTRIEAYPDAWEKQTESTRRYVLNRFPYKIVYRVLNDVIYILAIACSHRNPDYWVDRDV